jgi:transcriptional regulator GlxA family with amidase domain
MEDMQRERWTVVILLFNEVEVLDFAGPFEVFSVAAGFVSEHPIEVCTVARTSNVVRAIGGLKVLPDYTLAECPMPDVLVVPGGEGTRREMEVAATVEWVRAVHRKAELVMSVCSGARILARARLLDGLQVTTHHQVREDLRKLAPGAEVHAKARFIDTGRIVTTAGISAGIDGSFHVIARLFGEETARRTAAYMEYEWNPVPA